MSRVCLSILRFCLSAWLGIATFFVMLVIDLRQSNLFSPETKFDHPQVLFPLYYKFEFSLLIPALLCGVVLLWHSGIGRGRRIAILQLIIVAVGLAMWDYTNVYPRLLELMAARGVMPVEFHSLHRMSRWLNEALVVACGVATILALIPERTVSKNPPPPTGA
ncbi:MAG: hypothetical protein JSS02_05610 [Planctomycetes bacterium]|nr:hypothetical protein [Planctomycetota bacterium]